jgi:uncharacterized protein
MRKWMASLVSLFVVMMLLAGTAFAAGKQVTMEVDGEAIAFEAHALLIDNGVAYAPQDELFAALELMLDESGDETAALAAKTKDVDGIAYVPVRAVSEAVGYEVRWDSSTRTIVLVSRHESETDAAGGRGFLWEVEHKGNKVFLLGSMHLADESFYPLNPAMEEAFDEADYLGVEVDISKAADPAVQQLILSLGSYQDGTTLKDHVAEETYDKLAALLEENGIPAGSFDTFKPWVAEVTVQGMQAAMSGLDGQVGIDLYFITKAMERKLPIIELESFESQLQMFSGFSEELQEANLNAVIDSFSEIDDSLEAMAEMWKAGDEEALLELTASVGDNEEYNQAMLVDRNKAMTEKVVGYLNGDKPATYLIVVGAGHMLGETGIVTALEEQGYTVTRQ